MKGFKISPVDNFSYRRTHSIGTPLWTLAANPTDVAAIQMVDYSGKLQVNKVTITGFADTNACVEVLLQMAANGGGGTSTAVTWQTHYAGMNNNGTSYHELTAPAQLSYYTANGTGSRDGISSSRPILAQDILQFSTATQRGNKVVFDFGTNPKSKPTLMDAIGWIVVNLKGQAMPAGAKLQVTVEYEYQRVPRLAFCGDSTYSHATSLFQSLAASGDQFLEAKIDNLGNNGHPLSAFLTPGATGIVFAQQYIYPRTKDVMVLGFGINDVRLGATSQAQLTTMLNTAITNQLATNPDCKIILHGPNSLTSDNFNNMNYVTATGLFAGMTIAEAAQAATDIMYNAYQSFANDPRIFALVQRQDVTGRTVQSVAQSGLMTDQLHPNAKGQRAIARQLKPVLTKAINAVTSDNF